MTMPEERTRAVRWAGGFLNEILGSSDCPESLRRQARVILRHYPDASDIAYEAEFWWRSNSFPPWLAPERKDLKGGEK